MPVHGGNRAGFLRRSTPAGIALPRLAEGPDAPDAFEFTDRTNVGAGDLITSNTITLSGDGSWALSVSGAGSPEVQVNGGDWTDDPSVIVTNGDRLAVRLTAGDFGAVERVGVVVVGRRVVLWSVTSITAPFSLNFSYDTNSGYLALLEDI